MPVFFNFSYIFVRTLLDKTFLFVSSIAFFMGGAVRLGKNHLRWCYNCNLPILEYDPCPTCGGPTFEVVLTPPSDSRPAFDSDIENIRSLVDKNFGEGAGISLLPKGHIVLMNKCPGLDRMDEIIIDGAIIGSIRYDIGIGW